MTARSPRRVTTDIAGRSQLAGLARITARGSSISAASICRAMLHICSLMSFRRPAGREGLELALNRRRTGCRDRPCRLGPAVRPVIDGASPASRPCRRSGWLPHRPQEPRCPKRIHRTDYRRRRLNDCSAFPRAVVAIPPVRPLQSRQRPVHVHPSKAHNCPFQHYRDFPLPGCLPVRLVCPVQTDPVACSFWRPFVERLWSISQR